MERTVGQWIFSEGDEVFGSEGDKVGKVVSVHPTYIVVEKGFFFPMDYFIPMNAIDRYEEDRVYLGVTKEVALESNWGNAPETPDAAEEAATQYDATGTSKYADTVEHLDEGDALPDTAARLGTTRLMGESTSSPGLAGDLTAADSE